MKEAWFGIALLLGVSSMAMAQDAVIEKLEAAKRAHVEKIAGKSPHCHA